jgi:pimeloyl-ACP methyl ester carboxylesterase
MPKERINGFSMYYEVAGEGVPLLFVHGGLGGGRGSAGFRQLHMAALSRYATVIAFDRRAAGQSEAPATGYGFDCFVADILALLDSLGCQRAVLMGTSAGGPQVLQCALDHPERVMGLVLGSTASQTVRVPPELAALTTYLGTTALSDLQKTLGQASGGVVGGILQTYLAYHLHGDPIAERLAEIEAPALVLHGTADEEVPFAEGRRLHVGLRNASLVSFEGGGHGIMSSHAVPFRQAILDFLDGL